MVTNCTQFYNNESQYYKRPSPDDVWALYDLSLDPFETVDIANRHHDTIAVYRKWVLDGKFTCQCLQCGYGYPGRAPPPPRGTPDAFGSLWD